MPTRRLLIALAGASVLAACDKKLAPVTGEEDLFIGRADAPITLIEYASVACPVCAAWHNDVLPEFKKKYIDTGQVKLVTREMNAHNPAFSTAGFLVARCAGKDKYYDVVDAIYRDQAKMESSGDFRGGLVRIAKEVGLSEKQFDECVSDPVAIEKQNERAIRLAQQDGVQATPTFVIDGQVVAAGFIDMPQLDAIIATAKNKAAGGAAAQAPTAPVAPKAAG